MAGGSGSKRLEAMRANPRDWRIDDVRTVCEHAGLTFRMPRRGSHAKVSAPGIPDILTVPVRRPIREVYIRQLVALVDRVSAAEDRK